jgi:hypothetical protein
MKLSKACHIVLGHNQPLFCWSLSQLVRNDSECYSLAASKSFSQLRPVKPAEPDERIDRFTHALKPFFKLFTPGLLVLLY